MHGSLPKTYVRNGLVFWLDGIDRGNVTGSWVDKIGNITIPLTNVTYNTNGIVFDGTAYGKIENVTTGITPAIGTIEVCAQVETTAAGYTIFCGENSAIRFHFAGGNGTVQYSKISGDMNWKITKNNPFTASLNAVRCYFNGIAGVSDSTISWSPSLTSNCIIIGGAGLLANPAQYNKFVGTLYSIRIYNRQLSADEMLQNQQYDNRRFNLGITF